MLPQRDRRRLVVRAAKKKGPPVNKAAAAKKEKEAAEAAATAAKNATPYTDPDIFMHSLLLIDRSAPDNCTWNAVDAIFVSCQILASCVRWQLSQFLWRY